MKVIAIDDNKLKLAFIKGCLNEEDEFKSFENYNAGMEELKQNNYDLLVLDMHFPIIEGEKAQYKAGLYVLKQMEQNDIDIPTILYTSDDISSLPYNNVVSIVNHNPDMDLKREIDNVRNKLNNKEGKSR